MRYKRQRILIESKGHSCNYEVVDMKLGITAFTGGKRACDYYIRQHDKEWSRVSEKRDLFHNVMNVKREFTRQTGIELPQGVTIPDNMQGIAI